MNARIDQEELLVARAKGKRQEICTRLFQMPTKQSPASKKIRRATPIGNISSVRIAEGGLNFYFSFFLFHFRSIFYFWN